MICEKRGKGSPSHQFFQKGQTSVADETLSRLSCRELLGLAEASGGFADETQHSGRVNLLSDLISPPQIVVEPQGLSLQFAPLMLDNTQRMNLAADKDVVKANQDSEKGLTEETNLNETRQKPFDELIFEETSLKKSFSCWNGNFGSTSQTSVADDTLSRLFCRELIALAEATIADETLSRLSCRELIALAEASDGFADETQHSGLVNLLCDLNWQITPLTSDHT